MKAFNQLKYCILFIGLSLFTQASSQEIGYVMGVNKLGLSPSIFQPLYGISLGGAIHKNLSIETNCFYSQRTKQEVPISDYISFVLMPKIGVFKDRWALFYGPSIVLNPTLNHSNTQNHTYLSSMQTIGFQITLGKHLIADAKIGQDIGLSGAFYDNNEWTKFSGPVLLLGLKLNLGKMYKPKDK